MTEAIPAPLDAYETAKPNEPIFTLQGGDPLSAPLIRLWALLARVRTEVVRGDSDWIYPPLEAALRASTAHDPRESNNLLLRASQAEQVSWEMDSYRKGEGSAELQAERKTIDEFERLDIYDIRRRCASAISTFVSDLTTYKKALVEREFMSEELADLIDGGITVVKSIGTEIEIKRSF